MGVEYHVIKFSIPQELPIPHKFDSRQHEASMTSHIMHHLLVRTNVRIMLRYPIATDGLY